MYITMNRFQVNPERGGEFEEIWRTRDSFLGEVPGFVEFHFLRGDDGDYISHTLWQSKEAFDNWVESEAFRKAHARAHGTPKEIFNGPPRFTAYEVLLSQAK